MGVGRGWGAKLNEIVMAWENAKNQDLEKVKQVLKSWKNIGIYEKKEAVIKKNQGTAGSKSLWGKGGNSVRFSYY